MIFCASLRSIINSDTKEHMNLKRRGISLVVFLCLFLSLFLGCGNQASTKEYYAKSEETSEWVVTHTELEITLNKAVFYGNSLYGATEEKEGIRISEYELTSMVKKQDLFIDAVDNVSSISVKEDGNIVILGKNGEEYVFLEISDGELINKINDIQIEKIGLWPEIKGVYFSDDGYCFIWYRMTVPCTDVFKDGEIDVYTPVDRVYVKDTDMKTLSYDEIPDSYGNSLVSLLFDNDGYPVFLAKDDDGYYEKRIRICNAKEAETTRLDFEYNGLTNNSNIIMTGEGFAYTSKGDICFSSPEIGREERLFHLSVAGINETDIVSWQMREDEINIVDNCLGGENSEVTTISKGKSKKTVLRIAVMCLDESIRSIISSFNRYSNTIQLEPVVYAENYDFDRGIEQLKLDIIQDRAPDVFFVDGMEYEMLAMKGAFENLNDYIKSDKELSSNEIVRSVFEAYESDGNLYVAAPTFIIHTMWGGQSTVNDVSCINIDEITDLLDAKGKNINSIYGLATGDESALRALMAMEMNSFIEWDTGTCNFESEKFYNILKVAKNYDGADIGESLYNAIRSGNVLFTFGTISSVEDYCLQCEIYGERVRFIGYPTDSGLGSAIGLIGPAAINAKSENKEAAWEFIKYYVMNGGTTGFPTYVPRYEKMLSESLNNQYLDNGDESEKIAKVSYCEPEGIRLYIYSAEAEDVEMVRNLVENTSKKYAYEEDIQLIIEEEAAAFFQEQKTEQEIAKIVQSRISLFLAEKE